MKQPLEVKPRPANAVALGPALVLSLVFWGAAIAVVRWVL